MSEMKTIMPIEGELKEKGIKLRNACDEFLETHPYKNPIIWIDYDDGRIIITADDNYSERLKEYVMGII